ncbi:MAG: J domain-containing protein [Pirellulaceae bacterium]
MTDPSEPRWDLLPHSAEEFFCLADDYDLRDLKRSYNRLIRRFKPEKFPDEFQRIRAAYESLSDARRYGMPTRPASPPPSPSRPPRPEDAFESDAAVEGDAPAEAEQTWPAAPAAHAGAKQQESTREPPEQRIASMAADALYAELLTTDSKTAEEYIALAFLSDVVAQRASPDVEDASFVGWLLAGLAAHPGDWGLTELLREYLHGELPSAEIEQLLLRAVNVLPTERFQYVTERAWDRLLREATFEQFRDCLARCGARLGRAVDTAQLVFYVHILKLAMWKADDEFLEDMRATVEDHYNLLDGWVEGEFELVDSLLDYRKQREEFVSLGPCCRRIDRAIRDWCTLPETEGDRSVVDCQYFISMRGQRFLDELPEADDDLSFVLIPWDQIVADVLDRLGEPSPPEESALVEPAREFMIRCMRRRNRTHRYRRGLVQALIAFAMLAVAIITSGAYVVRMFWKLLAQGQYLGAFFDALLAGATLIGGFVVFLVVFLLSMRATAVRYEMVRRELMKLIRVAPVPVRQLAAVIEEREDEEFGDGSTIDDTEVIAEGLRSDGALELFSLAQICLHVADAAPIAEAELVEHGG